MSKVIHTMILWAFFFSIFFPPEAVSVDRKAIRAITKQGYQSIPEEKLRETFREYLRRRLGKEESDMAVSRFKVIGNRPVPAGKVSFQLFQKDKRGLEGYVRLVGIISVDGVVENKVRLSGWVDVFESVVCTSRNLKKGETVKEDDLYLARRNISHLSPNILTDMSKIVGLIVKHNLKKDTCLKEWMLERSPVFDRGDMVTILAESGNLKVTVSGMVLERGYLGELIRVRNAMSKKEIYARVINNSTVVVDF
jgi:flagella basal body P-ring formation protein FlgA